MREQEILGLHEAYASIYAPQEEVELEEGRWNNQRWNEVERQRNAADAEDRKKGLPQSYTDRRNRRRLAMGEYSPGAPHSERQKAGRQNLKDQGKVPKKGGKDMFEHILEHLVAEGYADTNQAALAIMANMSEEWKQSIMEMDDFSAGGGNAKIQKTGMSRDQVIELGKKNKANLAAKPSGSSSSRSSSSGSSSSGSSNSGGDRPKISADNKFWSYEASKDAADNIASWYRMDRKDPRIKQWALTHYRQNIARASNDPNYDPTKISYPEFEPVRKSARDAFNNPDK